MSFLSFVLRNLARQRVRTTLTVLGISIGVTLVVALGAVTGGVKQATTALLQIGGADFVVAQEGAADFTFSTLPEEQADAIADVPGVERTTGVLLYLTQKGGNPYFMVVGMPTANMRFDPPPLVAGALPAPGTEDEVMIGAGAADSLGIGVGDPIALDDVDLRVVGVYRTGTPILDGGAFAALAATQRLARKQGQVTAIYVAVEEGADATSVASAIEEADPNVVTVANVSETGKVDQGVTIIDALNDAVTILALLVGAVAVLNTMIMSVFERTREIGILRAVGWRGSRIVRMIVGEALVLCAVAAAVGIGLGVLATRALLLSATIRNFIEPQYAASTMARAVVVALVVALAGALYPAVRAVRLSPMEALRHE